MTPEQWTRIDELFAALADVDPAACEAALAAEEDADVRGEVRALLQHAKSGEAIRDVAAPIGEMIAGAFRNSRSGVEAPPQRFGPWRVTGVAGFGGMGAVYEAVRDDRAFDKKVAIKVLQLGHDAPQARERFRQEVAGGLRPLTETRSG